MFRFDSPLHFASSETFSKKLYEMTGIYELKRIKAKQAKLARKSNMKLEEEVNIEL